MKSRSEQFLQFSLILTVVFAFLIVWAFFSGTQIVDTKLPQTVFGQDEVEEAPVQFAIEDGGPLKMTVTGPTLNNSWLWVKTVVLDSNNIALVEHEFDLSYYHGPGWSEGNRSASWSFRLPPGSYKVLVYGENQEDIPGRVSASARRDLLHVEIESGIVLMRYFVLGFLAFLTLSFVANKRRNAEKAQRKAAANRQSLFS